MRAGRRAARPGQVRHACGPAGRHRARRVLRSGRPRRGRARRRPDLDRRPGVAFRGAMEPPAERKARTSGDRGRCPAAGFRSPAGSGCRRPARSGPRAGGRTRAAARTSHRGAGRTWSPGCARPRPGHGRSWHPVQGQPGLVPAQPDGLRCPAGYRNPAPGGRRASGRTADRHDATPAGPWPGPHGPACWAGQTAECRAPRRCP